MPGPIGNQPHHAPIPANREDVKKNLANYDTNQDGTVTREEFVKARADEMVAAEIDDDQATARIFDAMVAATPLANIIPAIANAGESLEFFGKAGFGGSFDAKNEEGRFKDFDVNNDGKVDFNEFHAGKFRERVASDEFGALDLNRDNVLVVDNDARQQPKADAAKDEAKAEPNPFADQIKAVTDAITSLLDKVKKDDPENKLAPMLGQFMDLLSAVNEATAPAKSEKKAPSYDFKAAGTAAKALKDIINQDAGTPMKAEKTDAAGYWSVGDKAADQYLLRKFPDHADRAVKEFYNKHHKLPTLAETVALTKRFADAGVDGASQQNVLAGL